MGYAAILDGCIDAADVRSTREEAECDAEWLRRHPARHDRMRFGRGGVVRVVRVTKCEWTGEWVEV